MRHPHIRFSWVPVLFGWEARHVPGTSLGAVALTCMALAAGPSGVSAAAFHRLDPVRGITAPKCSSAYPGGRYEPANLVDGDVRTEFSSNADGTNTFVQFDFGRTAAIAAYRHVDRNDPATVARAELEFLAADGRTVDRQSVTHTNRRGGVTFEVFQPPISARGVRWRVSKLGSQHGTVGGSEIAFFTSGTVDELPSLIGVEARSLRMLQRRDGPHGQPVEFTLNYPYAEPANVTLHFEGAPSQRIRLAAGSQTVTFVVTAVTAPKKLSFSIDALGEQVLKKPVEVQPVKPLDVYLLPHSHVDIGYTETQPNVEKKQDANIKGGLRLARASASYPVGSRFKWNVEVLWPVDNYLRKGTPAEREEFIKAVQNGQVGLDALYGNILTGLCRPEELVRSLSYAGELSRLCGVPIESAMISDVPGYTWSTVTALAHAGVRYFSFAPNYFDRMGGTMKEWQNRPFWWKSADGRSRVLCWCPSRGYALGHLIGDGEALARFIPDYLDELRTNQYPYEITHLRWNVHGDNGSPDEKIADVVRDWNAKWASPRLIISTTAEAFRAFEQRYGDTLPEHSGDYTPYWEDGAGSSAYETALNRASAERLVQAETLWAMRKPGPFPAKDFKDAWRNVLLYSEHTWGAHNSISQPDIPFVKEQWRIKQAFALDADRQSRALLDRALAGGTGTAATDIEVYNTASWERTGLVTLAPEASAAGDQVREAKGKVIPSQRLSSGELVFVAKSVPAFGSKRFSIGPGEPPRRNELAASATELRSPFFTLQIDPASGAITSLVGKATSLDLVDARDGAGLNEYLYLPGANLKDLKRAAPATNRVKELGSVLASVILESDAPGCKKLSREIRVFADVDHVEVINTVDKLAVRAKEGLHLAYPFNVPKAVVRIDTGLAAVRPEIDQIPASCKNWFSAQRWVDVSNERFGVTWAPVDAPLVQIGGITANLIGSQTDHRVWIQRLESSPRLYSWIMNNHWHTNYRADQEGPTQFRYAIRAHKGFSPAEASRFGAECSKPLIARAVSDATPNPPALELSSEDVTVAAFKPSDDGRGWIIRLFGASGSTRDVKLSLAEPGGRKFWLSDTSEQPRSELSGRSITVPGWGLVTVRIE